MRIIIINLTRFGDTLQSQPLMHTLKAKEHSLAYLGLENFVSAAQMLDGVSDVFGLPGGAILSHLCENKGDNWYNSLAILNDFVKHIHEAFSPDAILNLTPTNPARLLARKLSIYNGKDLPTFGFAFDEFGFQKNSTVWGNYIQAVTLNRISSPFNLSDGFTLLASTTLLTEGADNPSIRSSTPEDIVSAKKILNSLPLEGSSDKLLDNNHTKYIAFQLGASNEIRQWSTKNFALLSQLLAKEGYIPLLLGTAKEENLSIEFFSLGGVAKNALGRTNLPTLQAILQQCSLIVSNDTGTMHLAAAVKTPIVGIFLATAQPWDTGPVSIDACLVEPNLDCHPCDFRHTCKKNNICRKSIPAYDIAKIILDRLEHGSWQQHFSEDLRIWESVRDEFGFLSLKPLDIIDNNSRYSLYSMQRIVYKELLDILSNQQGGNTVQATFQKFDSLDPLESQKLKENLKNMLGLFDLLQQQSKLITQLPKMKQNFFATNQKIQMSLKAIDYLVPLAYMWEYGMEEYGNNLDEFSTFIDIIKDVMNKWHNALI